MTIAWFSCGITSAVACKIALNSYPDTRLYYIDTGSQQEDSMRFLRDCEKWYGRKIAVLWNEKYSDHFEVIERQGIICSNRVFYPCSYELKKKVRYRLEDELKHWDGQVFGFDTSEKLRARRFTEQNPNAKPLFPLIEHNLSKENAAFILHRAGIDLPRQYRLGYRNNNCIGCVRGGMGYWNRIRRDYPEHFERMARLERKIGYSCLRERINGNSRPLFLDELNPSRGNFSAEVLPSCDLFCELEFMNL